MADYIHTNELWLLIQQHTTAQVASKQKHIWSRAIARPPGQISKTR